MANPNTTGTPPYNGASVNPTPSLNPFFDTLNQITSVLGGGLDVYSSFKERMTAIKAIKNEQVTQPMQTSNSDIFGTSTMRAQQIILYAGTALFIGLAAYYVVKKA